MEILKNLKKNIFVLKKIEKNIYIRGHLISRIQGTREINGSRILMGLQYVTFSSWVYYKVNIGRIYPLELMFTKVAWNIINPAFS